MEVALTLFAYLLGSVPTGYIVGWLAGVDIRTAGSGNIGATNVARVVGRRRGLLTVVADTAKGFIPVLIAAKLDLSAPAIAFVAAGAFLGHLYPVFLKFKGGKGVATALGVFLALAPLATMVLLAIFVAVVFSSRIVSVGSMIAAVAAPVVLWLFSYPLALIGLSLFLAAMIIERHRANLQRLRAGTEPKFSF